MDSFPRSSSALDEPTRQGRTARPAFEFVPEHVPAPLQVSAYHDRAGIFGRVVATLLLALSAPFLVLSVLLICVASPGPILYRQVRVGRSGKRFTIYKLRTMVVDAERATGPVWSTSGDPRITLVGRLLRALNWDEIPQLLNVLKGDMNLVGPRPERPEISATILQDLPEYAERTLVCPGITGLAQINLPADTDLNSVRRKLQLDFEYIRQATAWMDFCIVLATLPRLFGIRSRQAARALGVHRSVRISPHGVAKVRSQRRRTVKGNRRIRIRPR
jgi:lipopolysaccharide/colanic/teichoic acid biosynthesis glycosyltransferase